MSFLVYGANGYTGTLIAEEAVRRGMRPILAGRGEDAVRKLAERLDLSWRCFALDDDQAVKDGIEGVRAVLLAAGPFSATSRPVVDACLAKKVHYLDITGEIAVFEAAFRRDEEAKKQGVALIPGVGFDVVPTDCLAKLLSNAMPEATELELAISGGQLSRGTAKTMIEGMGEGGAMRDGGRIQRVPVAWKQREIPFRDKPRQAMSIPWGDIATAWRSTGIPRIVTYAAAPPKFIRAMRLSRPLMPVLASGLVQSGLKRLVEARVTGPDADTRARTKVNVWGRVQDAAGREVTGTVVTTEGYSFTAEAAVECTRRLLDSNVTGAVTPSLAFGADLIADLRGDPQLSDMR